MLQEGDKIKIKYTKALLMLDLCELVTRSAVVTKVLYNDKKKPKGAYVKPDNGRLKDKEVYVPIQSIESEDYIKSLRTKCLIKQTIL